MTNQEIATIFHEITLYLEMQNVAFKPQAYEKAAMNLETLSEDVSGIYKKGGLRALEQIPGIGKGLAEKILRREIVKGSNIKAVLENKEIKFI